MEDEVGMSNLINIKKDRLKMKNLMRDVDFSEDFTLMDVFIFIRKGDIPLKILGLMIDCYCIKELMKEITSKSFLPEKKSGIDHLELSWGGEEDEWGYTSAWDFSGVGKIGEISKEMLKFRKKKDFPKDWIQGYAIEFTPLWKLSGYVIKIGKKMHFMTWKKNGKKTSCIEKSIKFTAKMNVIDLLYNIFYEISFAGNPKERDEEKEKILYRVKTIKKAINNGKVEFISTKKLKENVHEKTKKTYFNLRKS